LLGGGGSDDFLVLYNQWQRSIVYFGEELVPAELGTIHLKFSVKEKFSKMRLGNAIFPALSGTELNNFDEKMLLSTPENCGLWVKQLS
jgi:hypothetical protein